jgi:chemotaxis protein methyltransferase CheR
VNAAAGTVMIANATPRPPSDREFAAFRDLIERETGIHLAPAKKALLTARLIQRIRELGLDSFGAYLDRLLGGDRDECVRMLDRVSTNETHFFREPHHFDLIRDRVVPRWVEDARLGRRPKRVVAWSAGCSSGEEPYSLAMALLDALPANQGWEIQITGTDLSTRVLAHAEAAVYRADRIEGVPEVMRRRYLLRGVGEQRGNFKIAPEVRTRVRFSRLNLMTDGAGAADHDLVMCRNVLIYFRAETRTDVVNRLATRLVGGGLLFLGHAETLPLGIPILRTVVPTVYERLGPTRFR